MNGIQKEIERPDAMGCKACGCEIHGKVYHGHLCESCYMEWAMNTEPNDPCDTVSEAEGAWLRHAEAPEWTELCDWQIR
jgi:hypothetical protein